MAKRFFPLVWAVLVTCTLLLSGCSDFEEMKSKRLLTQAEALLQQGNESQAEQALADLVARYPATQAGATASQHLSRIQEQRKVREREVFAKVLDSYQQVLNGYRALYAEYPRSLSVLNESGYFFDSAYLEEVTPERYQTYLWLKSDGSGYRLWCVAQDLERGYVVDSQSRNLVPFNRDEVLGTIKMRFQAGAWDGKLVAMRAHN